MKITVWGGSGFLGSHICDALSNNGYDVTIADICKSPWKRDDQQMLVGSLLDKKAVNESVKNADYVFNFAGIADIGEANDDPHKSAALLFFKDIRSATETVIPLQKAGAQALELMDRAALRSIQDEPGIPKEIKVSYVEIAHALDKSISKIEEAILSALEMTPPELSADIYRTGIYLAGGGSMLRGLDKRISMKTKLPVHVAEDPLRAVARGTGIALKNAHRFPFLMR